MKIARTSLLDVAYESGGPADGPPVLLLHGWPDDATAWRGVTPALEAAGYRWVAPWLRGHGGTSFLSNATLRDGSGVAIAQDALDLVQVLGWERFAIVGHDWGGRAAYILAAIAPERLTSITALAIGYAPRGRFATPTFAQSRRWWYQWFVTTEGGAAAVREDPIGFARLHWKTWGPTSWMKEAEFVEAAESFRNPDWVAVTLHGYRSRWQAEPSDPRYTALRDRVDATEVLHVRTLMIQGGADCCDPPDQSEEQHHFFSAGYRRIVLDGVGHFPTRESPAVVAEAITAHLR